MSIGGTISGSQSLDCGQSILIWIGARLGGVLCHSGSEIKHSVHWSNAGETWPDYY